VAYLSVKDPLHNRQALTPRLCMVRLIAFCRIFREGKDSMWGLAVVQKSKVMMASHSSWNDKVLWNSEDNVEDEAT